MKFPDIGRKHRRSGKGWLVTIIFVLSLFCLFGTVAVASTGEGGGADHGSEESKGWVATDTYRVINFTVLAAALFFILRKPVSGALSSRIKNIQNQLSDLEAKKIQAEKELVKYNAKLADLDKEAKKVVEMYIKQGQDAKAKIIEEAKIAAEKLEAQALRNIEQEFKQAKESIQAEIVEKALLRAEALVQKNIDERDQDRLVDEYLQKVVG